MKAVWVFLAVVVGLALFSVGVWVGSSYGIKAVPILKELPIPIPSPSPSPTPSPVVNPFEEAPVNPFEKIKTNPFE